MNITLIIVTKDRLQELAVSLQAAAEQTQPWQQVIVVDGGNDALRYVPAAVKNTLPLEYYQSASGIARQRNVARQHVRKDCDLVVYCDDDTHLEPDARAKIESFFLSHHDLIGFTGHIVGEKRAGPFKRLFGGMTCTWTNRVYGITSGVFNSINETRKIQRVQWLPGAFMVYDWKRVFDMEFDEWFTSYGLGEDLDFSLRAGRRGKLFIAPAIRVVHSHSVRGRNWRQFGYMRIVNRRYIRLKHFSGSSQYWLGYWWANFWLLVVSALRVPFNFRSRQEHIGYWHGLWVVLFKK